MKHTHNNEAVTGSDMRVQISSRRERGGVVTIVYEQKLENVGKANKMEQPNTIRHNQ